MNKFDKNFLFAKFISVYKNENNTILKMPNGVCYDVNIILKEGDRIPITELNFNEDWNLIMLVAKKFVMSTKKKYEYCIKRNLIQIYFWL